MITLKRGDEVITNIYEFEFIDSSKELSITFNLPVPPSESHNFDREYFVEYNGEKFNLDSFKPTGKKTNNDINYVYTLIMKTEREKLKHYNFANFVNANDIGRKTNDFIFAFNGTISQFIDRFNLNLQYFLPNWSMVLSPGWVEDEIPANISVNNSKLWDVLDNLNKIYGVNWDIQNNQDKYVIRVGYAADIIEHVFEYGVDENKDLKGLVNVERINPNEGIITKLRSKGGSKNIPVRYFKPESTINGKDWPGDPDANSELENIYFKHLMPSSARNYVRGWNDAKAGNASSNSNYAYMKGRNDYLSGNNFDLVDYTLSPNYDKWGEREDSLEPNETIYPTIQGAEIGGKRIDTVIAVEQVVEDDIYNDTDTKLPIAQKSEIGPYTNSGESYNISAPFTVSSNADNISMNINAECTTRFDVSINLTIQLINRENDVRTTIFQQTLLQNGNGLYDEVKITAPITKGTYNLRYSATAETQQPLVGSNFQAKVFFTDISLLGSGEYKHYFNIWIPDLGFDITDQKYWSTSEMTFMFSDGALAGEDYTFRVVNEKVNENIISYAIEEDDSFTYNGIQSKYRVQLEKSDSEFDATGKQLPNKFINAVPGNHFFIVNIELPQVYIELAEERQQMYSQQALSLLDDEYPTYAIGLSPLFLSSFGYTPLLKSGNMLRVRDKELIGGEYLPLYIQSITLSYSNSSILPECSIVVSEDEAEIQGTISLIQSSIDKLNTAIYAGTNYESLAQTLSQWFLLKNGTIDSSSSPTYFREKVTFGKQIESQNFVSASLTGKGAGIYPDANGDYVIEADIIKARKRLEASQLVIQQIDVFNGKILYTAAGMVCNRVENFGSFYRCFFDTENGQKANAFVIGDQAISQRFNPESNEIIKYYWKVVVDVGVDYIDLSNSLSDGDGIPFEGDNISQLGHISNKLRQSAFIIDQTAGGSVTQYGGIDSFSFENKNLIGFGKKDDGDAYFYSYGDFYFGDKELNDENGWITYQIREGEEDKGRQLLISSQVIIGAGSEGLTNLGEWDNAQKQIDDANDKADEAIEISEEAKAIAEETKNFQDNVLPLILDGLQNQIDGVVEFYFEDYDPSLANEPALTWIREGREEQHLNDVFTNRTTGYGWRWVRNANNTYDWVIITDTAVLEALQKAAQAQDTADSKRRVFTSTPFTPYDAGDLWSQPDRPLFRCYTSRLTGNYTASDWNFADNTTGLIENLQDAADAAKEALELAQKEAEALKERLEKLASDDYISDSEKISLKVQWRDVVTEFESISKDADRYSLKTTNQWVSYYESFLKADAAFNKYTQAIPEFIPVEDDFNNIINYYTVRQNMYDLISETLQGYVDGKIEEVIKMIPKYNLLNNSAFIDTEFNAGVPEEPFEGWKYTNLAYRPSIIIAPDTPSGKGVFIQSNATNTGVHILSQWVKKMEIGKMYTLSVYAKTSDTGSLFLGTKGKNVNLGKLSKEFELYSWSFLCEEPVFWINIGMPALNVNNNVIFSSPMLVEGEVPAPWNFSKEDLGNTIELAEDTSNMLDEWADDGVISPLERQAVAESYQAFVGNYSGFMADIEAYINYLTTAELASAEKLLSLAVLADAAYVKYSTSPSDPNASIKIESDYKNIANYWEYTYDWAVIFALVQARAGDLSSLGNGYNYMLGTYNSKRVIGNGTLNQTSLIYYIQERSFRDSGLTEQDSATCSFDWEASEFFPDEASFYVQSQTTVSANGNRSWYPFSHVIRTNNGLKGTSVRTIRLANTPTANMPILDSEFLGLRMDYIPSTCTITIKNFKIEKGQTATGWSPNPYEITDVIPEVKEIGDNLDRWADDGYISPVERLAIAESYKTFVGDFGVVYNELFTYSQYMTLSEIGKAQAVITAAGLAETAYKKYSTPLADPLESRKIESDYANISAYWEKRADWALTFAAVQLRVGDAEDIREKLKEYASDGYISPAERTVIAESYNTFLEDLARVYGELNTYYDYYTNLELQTVTKLIAAANLAQEAYVKYSTTPSDPEASIKIESDYANIAAYWDIKVEYNVFMPDVILRAGDASDVRARLDRWADDGYISPVEKQELIREGLEITRVYNSLYTTLGYLGLSSNASNWVTYTQAYNALKAVITKYTAESPENIVIGSDFYTTFDDYYLRENGIRAWFQQITDGKAVTAGNSAEEALKKANDASSVANTVKNDLVIYASDSYISPSEKSQLKLLQAQMTSDYNELTDQVTKYGINTSLSAITTWRNSYNLALTAFGKYTAASPTNIPISVDFQNINAYYTNRIPVTKLIADVLAEGSDVEPGNVTYTSDEYPSRYSVPNPNIGDSWTDKVQTFTYFEGGWYLTGDDTETTINKGLITTGAINLCWPSHVITAGINGGGSDPSEIRFFSGSRSSSPHRSATFKVLDDGTLITGVIFKGANYTDPVNVNVINPDGSASFAQGNLKWNSNGDIEAENGIFRGTIYAEDGSFTSVGTDGTAYLSGNELGSRLSSTQYLSMNTHRFSLYRSNSGLNPSFIVDTFPSISQTNVLQLVMRGLPTSTSGLAVGQVWRDGTTLKVVV